jgi:hypothetical protein
VSFENNHPVAWRLNEVTPNPDVALFLSREHEAAAEVDLSTIIGPAARLDDRRFIARDMLSQGSASKPEDAPRSPVPEIVALTLHRHQRTDGSYREYPDIGDDRFAMVGAGAGSILLASYLTLRGADPKNITIFDPANRFGGIWRDKDVRMGGFNNPVPLSFTDDHHLDTRDRRGNNMRDFLDDIAGEYLRKVRFVGSEVTSLVRDDEGTWQAKAGRKHHEADYVVLANGTPIPRKLDGKRISTNLDELDHGKQPLVERQQRKLTNRELRSGRPIVLIGLGNSTAAMINQIHRYEWNHRAVVPYYVLTDRSWGEVRFPDHNTRMNGKPTKPVFRDPKNGYLTGFSGDLSRDQYNYWYMVESGRIMTGVEAITHNGHLEAKSKRDKLIIDDPLIFALIGNERDPKLFDQIKSINGKGHEPQIRACDGAVATKEHGYNSNVFAIGAVAATRRNPNAAVIPGIMSQVPGTTLTIALRSFVRHLGEV